MSTWASIIATNWDPDEWEIVNDDGFVYKRKKRRIDPTSFARAPDPEPDPALRIKEKRKNKRAALLKLKEKYLKEISGWDNLSNTLKAKQDSVISKREQVKKSSGEDKEGGKLLEMGDKGFESVDNSSGSLLDELLKQVLPWFYAVIYLFMVNLANILAFPPISNYQLILFQFLEIHLLRLIGWIIIVFSSFLGEYNLRILLIKCVIGPYFCNNWDFVGIISLSLVMGVLNCIITGKIGI